MADVTFWFHVSFDSVFKLSHQPILQSLTFTAYQWEGSFGRYSGRGLPLVSGANQITTIPTTYTNTIVAPALE
jgi:hypothetical protein